MPRNGMLGEASGVSSKAYTLLILATLHISVADQLVVSSGAGLRTPIRRLGVVPGPWPHGQMCCTCRGQMPPGYDHGNKASSEVTSWVVFGWVAMHRGWARCGRLASQSVKGTSPRPSSSTAGCRSSGSSVLLIVTHDRANAFSSQVSASSHSTHCAGLRLGAIRARSSPVCIAHALATGCKAFDCPARVGRPTSCGDTLVARGMATTTQLGRQRSADEPHMHWLVSGRGSCERRPHRDMRLKRGRYPMRKCAHGVARPLVLVP